MPNQKISKTYTDHIQNILRHQPDRRPFFITTILHQASRARSASLSSQATYAMQQYGRVYRHLTSNLMNNFSKKLHLQPLTFDFLDLPHTRKATIINLYEPCTPHIHSIYLVHEATLTRFRTLHRQNFYSITSHPALKVVSSIDCRPIEDGTLPRTVSYAAKLLENPLAVLLAGDAPLYTQHPIATFERDCCKRRRADIPS